MWRGTSSYSQPSGTSWDELNTVIWNTAVDGLGLLVEDAIREAITKIEKDLNKARVDIEDMTFTNYDIFERFPPVGVTKVGDIPVTQYRNVEGEINADVYSFGEIGAYGVVYL